MQLTWPAWILVVCVVASFVCMVVGAILAGVALKRFSKHLDRTSAQAEAIVDAQRLESSVARITNLIDGIEPLLERSRSALNQMNAALVEFRLPEAMLALRTARAAVRLLFSGR